MSDPASTAAIFLSYARDDATAARRMAEALRASGLEVWFDENELVGGDAWDSKIKRQIRDCTLLLPVISQHTQRRREGYFRLEWHLAEERSRLIAKGTPFLVPVVIDGTPERDALVPEVFLAVQWTRLLDGKTTPEFVELVKRLVGSGATAGAAGPGPIAAKSATPQVRRRVPTPFWVGTAAVIVAGAATTYFATRKSDSMPSIATSNASAPKSTPPISEARQLVAKARALYEPWDFASRQDFELAEQMLKKAVDLDPADGDAWAAYALLSCGNLSLTYDYSDERRANARLQAERALKLAPNSDAARFAFALSLRFNRQIEESIRLLREEAMRQPINRLVLRMLGATLRAAGQHEQSIVYLDKALALPGRDPIALHNRSLALLRLGRYAESEAAIDEALALEPGYVQAHTQKIILLLDVHNDLEAAKAYLGKVPKAFYATDNGAVRAGIVWLYARDGTKCLETLRLARDFQSTGYFVGPKSYLTGMAHRLIGNEDAAQTDWRAALQVVEQRLSAQPNASSLLEWKAVLLALLRQTAEADLLLREITQRRKSGDTEVGNLEAAQILVLLKRTDEAVVALSQGDWWRRESWNRSDVRYNPIWDPLRGDPRFEALLKRPEPAQKK